LALPRVGVDAALTAGIAAVLAAVAFAAEGGLLLGRTTKVELVLLAGSGLTVATATLTTPRRGPVCGLTTAGAFLALALFTVPPLIWLGARRQGPPALNALAFPGLGIVLVALMLAYSRGALLALVIGCAFWFAAVPLRLRGAAVLTGGGLGAALVTLWTFSQDALTEDRVPLGLRVGAGHRLGLLLLALVLGLTALGLIAGFAAAARPLDARERRRAGIGVLCAVALVPAGIAVALTQTERGL